MSATADRYGEVTSSILRGWEQALQLCVQLGDGYRAAGDVENAQYYDEAVRRYRQAVDGARDAWAIADRLETLGANADRDSAWDAETASCDARDTEEMPRVH